jgi:3-phenylpropionate/trans-cinnamate dioxygenase ferredoxin subunit
MTPFAERYVTVARLGEIPEGGVKIVRVEDQPIAVFLLKGNYYAIDDACSHDGGPLAEGLIEGDTVECPRHGSRFDIRTGAVLNLPATAPVATYPVRVDGDEIKVGWLASGEAGAPVGSGTAGSPAKPAPAPASATTPPSAAAPGVTTAPEAPASSPSPAAPPQGSGTQPAPSQQEFAVRAALESVIDPEINLSVIDLGLIREIHFLPDRTLVKMMLTTPFCPYAPEMMAEVKQTTMSVVALPCEVEILPDAWSPELMPDPGLLGFSF